MVELAEAPQCRYGIDSTVRTETEGFVIVNLITTSAAHGTFPNVLETCIFMEEARKNDKSFKISGKCKRCGKGVVADMYKLMQGPARQS